MIVIAVNNQTYELKGYTMEIMSLSISLFGGLISKFQKIVEQSVAGLILFKRACADKACRLVKAVGSNCRGARVKSWNKLFHDILAIFSVPVNYGESDAIFTALKVGNFGLLEYFDFSPRQIPLVGFGRFVHKVHIKRLKHDRDLGGRFSLRVGFSFTDPLTALRFVCVYPDRLKKHSLAIRFVDTTSQFCWLYLYEVAGRRRLRFFRGDPRKHLNANVRFLTVRGG